MKSVFSWFITATAVIFWIFRVVVAMLATFKVNFAVVPINMNIEIGLLFATLPCLVLILRRNMLGGLVYFGMYAWYFGTDLVNILNNIFANNMQVLSTTIVTGALVDLVAIFISLLNLFDIIFSRYRKSETPSKKVDWFYKNKQFDRNIDERTDKNNYRIY